MATTIKCDRCGVAISYWPNGNLVSLGVAQPSPPPAIVERTDWHQMAAEVSALIKRLHDKPADLKLGHWNSVGSILNAYREGDLGFDEAVKRLRVVEPGVERMTQPEQQERKS